MDLISVIVPIYQVEPYLDGCIRSIVHQTYTNLEIILVDDGSPDRCPVICDDWAARDSRIKVIHKENGGLSDARNAGMAAATGNLLSFIDSDDAIAPDFLEKLYGALTEYHADVAECAVSYVNEAGEVLRERKAAPVQTMDHMEALRHLVLEDGIYQTVWNKLYRRSAVINIPFVVGKYNEDEFWTWQVFDRIGTLAVVQEPLYYYLQRGSSIIGVGYNLRRLDGLDAQFQRMESLQKYQELAGVTCWVLMMQCMWQYQTASRLLRGEEKQRVLVYIRNMVRQIPDIERDKMSERSIQRLWIGMFRKMPGITVAIRNVLKVGM